MIVEVIQQMCKKELYINVGVENQEWKVYLDRMKNMNYNIARSGRHGLLHGSSDISGHVDNW
jgi:hypothetical protein